MMLLNHVTVGKGTGKDTQTQITTESLRKIPKTYYQQLINKP